VWLFLDTGLRCTELVGLVSAILGLSGFYAGAKDTNGKTYRRDFLISLYPDAGDLVAFADDP
jgi:hypothetical protein